VFHYYLERHLFVEMTFSDLFFKKYNCDKIFQNKYFLHANQSRFLLEKIASNHQKID